MTSPQVLAASKSERTEAEVRGARRLPENALATAIFAPSTHPSGMTSLGAARKIERELMEIALADLAETIARIRTYAKTSEAMETGFIGLADSITDAMHDNGITREFWASQIEAMR